MEQEMSKSGIELIAQERAEQIQKHGFSIEQDARYYMANELVKGALFCVSPAFFEWPCGWDSGFRNKIIKKNRIDQLAVAGALIAAEIDRINALTSKSTDNG